MHFSTGCIKRSADLIKQMKRVILTFLLILSFNVLSQSTRLNSSILGMRFNGYVLSTTEFHEIGKSKTFELRLEPYFLFPISSRFAFGLLGEYQTAGSTLSSLDIPADNYGIGFLARYNYPFKFNNEFLNRKLLFFAETSISFTNYYNSENNVFPVSKSGNLDYLLLRLRPIGMNFVVVKGFNVDLSFCVFKFFPGRWRSLPNIGLSYYFKNRSEKSS